MSGDTHNEVSRGMIVTGRDLMGFGACYVVRVVQVISLILRHQVPYKGRYVQTMVLPSTRRQFYCILICITYGRGCITIGCCKERLADISPLGPGYTRDWLPAYSSVSRARARRDTTRQDCFVVIPAHTGVTIVYCCTVVPSCSSQMSAR